MGEQRPHRAQPSPKRWAWQLPTNIARHRLQTPEQPLLRGSSSNREAQAQAECKRLRKFLPQSIAISEIKAKSEQGEMVLVAQSKSQGWNMDPTTAHATGASQYAYLCRTMPLPALKFNPSFKSSINNLLSQSVFSIPRGLMFYFSQHCKTKPRK